MIALLLAVGMFAAPIFILTSRWAEKHPREAVRVALGSILASLALLFVTLP